MHASRSTVRLASAILIMGIAVLATMPAARAGLVIVIEPSSLQAGLGSTDNSFDVVLAYEGDDAGPLDLTFYSVNLYVSDTSGVVFTEATGNTADSLLFGDLGSSLTWNTFDFGGNRYINFNDFPADAPFSATVEHGQRWGLARVFYSVEAGALPGLIPVMIEAATTELLDASNLPDFGDPLPFSTRGATISVVPEPSSLVLLGSAIPLVVGVVRRGRKSSVKA